VKGWLQSLAKSIFDCSRRWKQQEEEETNLLEKPFWLDARKEDEAADKDGQDTSKVLPNNFELATALKDDGNSYFSKGEIKEAIQTWTKALNTLHHVTTTSDREEEAEREGAEGTGAAAKRRAKAAASAALFQAEEVGRGAGNTQGAILSLLEAADAYREAAAANSHTAKQEDRRVVEVRATLFSNLALAYMKFKEWRQALVFCDEALVDLPHHQKSLYRKAECLGELDRQAEGEEALALLESTGDEGKRLAAQRRDAWKKKAKAADDRQKKMWAAALSKADAAAAAPSPNAAKASSDDATNSGSNGNAAAGATTTTTTNAASTATSTSATAASTTSSSTLSGASASASSSAKATEPIQSWHAPKAAETCIFDLRRKGIEWNESTDFDDKVWKDGIGRKEAKVYFQQALPLSLVSAFALTKLELPEPFWTVHVILDGNTAPFAEPHEWGILLSRFPHLQGALIVYIDIGIINKKGAEENLPYGVLLHPLEEASDKGRVVHSTRFLGSYKEFRENCSDKPRVGRASVVLWADAPIFDKGENDLGRRLEALKLATDEGAPVVFLQESEIIDRRGGPPGGPWLAETARQSMAILDLGLGAVADAGWFWNRFVVPLDQTDKGVLAAHAILGVVRLNKKKAKSATASSVKTALKQHGLEAKPAQRVVGLGPPNEEEAAQLQAQWVKFCELLRRSGRPVGPNIPPEEQQRQYREFQDFCRASGLRPK